MNELGNLLDTWEAHLDALRDGLAQFRERYAGLAQQNTALNARRESLEQQVMDMALEGWEKVISLYAEGLADEEDDQDDDFETDLFPVA